ncbi:MAG TPA: universal stress protein [Pyrinomonadaceae bacterium]|jgi:nucleotide-binding universal stress UspA family protein|nr:universal stress protein [Pyrinomonadaceae bacterium]
MKILIGVDGSPYSDAAIDEVAQRVWPEGSEVRVVHAFELPLSPTPEVWALPTHYYEQLDHALRSQSQSIVAEAVEKLKAASGESLKVDSEIILGSPRAALIDEAARWKADLIVVGSHGYPTWERFLLGSVSQSVVSHANCSVEVVRIPKPTKLAA